MAEKGKAVTAKGKARGVPASNSKKAIAARRTRSTAASDAPGVLEHDIPPRRSTRKKPAPATSTEEMSHDDDGETNFI
eukprot:5875620-Pleurochrysis_carterae.AAC.1